MMDRIKVVRLVPVLDFGGVESRLVLTSELIDRDRFDYRICTFWKPGVAAHRIESLGIPVDVLGEDPAVRNVDGTVALARYLRAQSPDVVHGSISEGIFHTAIAGAVADVPVRILEEVGMPTRSPLARAIFGSLSHLAATTVGVAQVVCDYLEHEENMVRVRCVHNCGKPEYFGDVTRTWDVPDGRPFRILNVGRLVWEKNQVRLIQAFGRLRARGLDAELWIAGEGEERPALEAEIEAQGLGDSVKLLGFRDDVRALVDQADLFVLPSVSEGCSVTLVESMATGTPVLASTFPGNLELLGPLSGACSVDPLDLDGWAEAMHAVADMSPAAREALGRRGREVARAGFSPDVYMRRVEDMYATLTARAKGAA